MEGSSGSVVTKPPYIGRMPGKHYAQNPAFSIEATKIFGSGVVNGPKGLFGS